MSATYVAWNAKPYPWPPPEGWYLASDGQWWAPGTGPNPPQVTTDASVTAKTAQAANAAQVTEAVVAESRTPASATRTRAVSRVRETPTDSETPDPDADDDSVETPTDRTSEKSEGAIWQPPSQRPTARRRNGMLVGSGLLILAVIAAAIYAITASSDTTSTDTLAETENPAPASSVAVSTTTAPPSSTTSAAETTVQAAAGPAQIAEYRARLDANGLSGEELTDADIAEFGSSFCVFALVAEDAEAFDGFRAEAIAENVGELSPDELNLAIDDAINVFCPDEAAKVGIS